MKLESIIYIGKNRDDILHCHRHFHEFHIGARGRARFFSGLDTGVFGPGRFAYVPPGWQHQMRPEPEMEFYYILFTPDPEDEGWLERLCALLAEEPTLAIPDYQPGRLRRVEALARAGDPFGRECAARILLGLVHELIAAGGPHAGESDAVTAGIRFMQGNLGRNPPVTAIAAESGLSVSSFIRAFSRQTGYTPHRYLNKLKIETACYQLNHSDKPIKVIARELGFCDEYHFSKVFRAFVGRPPARYRREMMLVR